MKFIDHISEVFEIFPYSEIARNIKLHRTKCTCVATNVLEKRDIDSLSSELKKSQFSLHEGTDIAQSKLIPCIVKYFSKVQNNVVLRCLNLFHMMHKPVLQSSLQVQSENDLRRKTFP